MTAKQEPQSYFSIFTMALLEDTGWYQVDYSLADKTTFGKDKGCNFVKNTCNS